MTTDHSFQHALDHLLESKKAIPASHFDLYSDLDPKSLRLFQDAWPHVEPARKTQLLDGLLKHFDEDSVVSYEEIAHFLLTDPDAGIRTRALRLLAESEDPKLVRPLTDILLQDPVLEPRLEAAALIGNFVLLGELGVLEEADKARCEDALIEIIHGSEDPYLRKASLQSIGFSSHQKAADLIETAFERDDPTWKASALVAMGRSQDEQWTDNVMNSLLDEDPLVQEAAVKAAGDLSLNESLPLLIRILDDEETDDDVFTATVWSLSQIGGEEARLVLLNLQETLEDEVAVEFVEEALENLELNEGLNNFNLFMADDLEDDDLEDEEAQDD